jgi:hypothetical protein
MGTPDFAYGRGERNGASYVLMRPIYVCFFFFSIPMPDLELASEMNLFLFLSLFFA